ncbi:hypothetical protein [Novipirellula artificiosorum]|uniref:hypothetical protein n=1 Tax=Novipirellula artificiosorum TaxID=2528016 RepID=UPI001E417293|nr:hypothetical protein [Novipirellula artificiosorum]
MNEIVVKGSDIIILAILVLAVGNGITQKISLLRKFSIPIAVTTAASTATRGLRSSAVSCEAISVSMT